jgi:hypothetical protein
MYGLSIEYFADGGFFCLVVVSQTLFYKII